MKNLKKVTICFLFVFILCSCSLFSVVGRESYGPIRQISHSELGSFLDKAFFEWSQEAKETIHSEESLKKKPDFQQISKGLVDVALQTGNVIVTPNFSQAFQVWNHQAGKKENLGTVQGKIAVEESERSLILTTSKGKFLLNDTLVFRPIKKNSYFSLKKQDYSGELKIFLFQSKNKKKPEVVKRWKGNLVVVNRVEIEEYLRGVVPSEMPSGRKEVLEALKVQAIAARTFVYAHLGYNKTLGFDLYDDVRDQVYLGRKTYPFSDQAILETQNMILVDREKNIAVTVYHSVCGGKTVNISTIWNTVGKTYPYLNGIKDRGTDGKDYCRYSKHYQWEVEWSRKKFVEILNKSLARWEKSQYVPFKHLRGLKVKKRSLSGRVQVLEINTDKKKFIVKGDRIRWVLRQPSDVSLKSTLFKFSKSRNKIVVKGKGFGHGAGMCQVGAMQQAREKKNFRQIIRHYYPTTQLLKIR